MDIRTTPRIAVLGPGGVGGLLAGLLARAGYPVTCVASPSTAEVLSREGLHVTSRQFGEFHAPVTATPCLSDPVDVCLIAVKATTLTEALDRVPAGTVAGGLVVPLLNGVDHMAALRRVYPDSPVVAGAIRVESTRTAPGRIVHTTPAVSVDLADRPAIRPLVERCAEALRASGVRVTTTRDEATVLWRKLVMLAPLALLTTAHRVPVGQVRQLHRPEMERVIAEVSAVASACGVSVSHGDILAEFDRFPPGLTSSMHRDADRGNPIELDAIAGAVLREGRRRGVCLPATTRLVRHLEGVVAPAPHPPTGTDHA